MALISRSLPSMINGVSQQPDILRLDSQAESQINTMSSVADGLLKRAPTEHLAKLSSADHSNSFVHMIDRDAAEKYTVILDGSDLLVFDTQTGAAKTVTFPAGKTYITEADASVFRAVTVADTTFILNTNKTTALGAASTDNAVPSALVFVWSGINDTTYTIKLDGTSYSTTTAASGQIKTSAVISALAALIPATYTMTIEGSLMRIRKTDNSAFTFSVWDSYGEQAMQGVKDVVQDFKALPPKAIGPMLVRIDGSSDGTEDDYYMEWTSTTTDGAWTEARGAGLYNTLDNTTMPHALVSQADGTFTFELITWNQRLVGDASSVPAPSFIGGKLTGAFFFRNRLGFTSDENLIMSRAGDYFNFWPTTAMDVLDDDPIDLGVAHVRVSILKHAIPFNKSLLLSSEQTQFMLTADGPLTPMTVKLDQTTEFEVSGTCAPVGAGPNLYFSVEQGDYSHFREYFVVAESVSNNADNIAAHCPRYVPSGVYSLVSSTNMDIMAALTTSERNAIYIYQYYWQGEEKAQSAWQKWTFNATDTVVSAGFSNNLLYLLIQRADGLYLEKMNLDLGYVDAVGFNVLLDRKTTLTGTYDVPTDKTTFTLPYPDAGDFYIVPGSTFTGLAGTAYVPTRVNSTTLTIPGDFSAGACYVGRTYDFVYQFSTQYVKETEASTGTLASRTDGRLQLRTMSVNFEDTGYFNVNVTPKARETNNYEMTGKVLGSSGLILGVPSLETGSFRFPLYGRNVGMNVEIHNETHLPCKFQSAVWEGEFVSRSSKI